MSLSSVDKQELLFLLEERQKRDAKKHFWTFCLFYDHSFFSKRTFLKRVADAFQKIYEKKIKSLAVSMPPRAGKSYIASLFAAWMLGNNPEGSVMRNACTSTLYDKFSYDTRSIIRNEKFQTIFPNTKLADDKQNLSGWNLSSSRQVGYFGAGVGGTIIGFGASVLAMTDDLYKSIDDALSETKNESIHRWKESAHDSRLEKNCPRVDIGTRWSINDVIGKNCEEKKYDEVVVIPAMVDGKSFCEDVKSTEEYEEIRSSIPSEIWDAEYMQQPAEVKGILFQKSDLKRFKLKDLDDLLDDKGKKLIPNMKLGYADIADEGDDYFSAPFADIYPNRVYVTNVIFTRDNVDVTMPRIVELTTSHGTNYVRVEANNAGAVFIKFFRKLVGGGKVLSVNHNQNKHTRILMEYGFIKTYFYFLDSSEYAQGSDYDLFMKQLFSYMKDGSSKHDDAPDSVAGLSKFIHGFLQSLFK